MDITIAPVNKPINPDKIKPPTTPIKITTMGTGAPLPKRIGFSTLSERPTTKNKTVHIMADWVSLIENI